MTTSTTRSTTTTMGFCLLIALILPGLARGGKVFIVDKANNTIYYSDLIPGSRLTDLIYQEVEVEGQISRPGLVTYDAVEGAVVWTQVEDRTIKRAQLNEPGGSVSQITQRTGASSLVFDRVTRRLIWLAGLSFNLNSINLDGSSKLALWNLGQLVHAINIDDIRGLLYWAEDTRIMTSDLQILDKTILVDGLSDVRTLYFDIRDNHLYWINEPGLIESFDVTSQERRALVNISSEMIHPSNITVHEGVLYWVDRGRGGIGSIDLRSTDQDPEQTVRFSTALYGENGARYDLGNCITDLRVFSDGEVDYCLSSPCPANLTCMVNASTYSCVKLNITTTTEQVTTVPDSMTDSTMDSVSQDPCIVPRDQFPCDPTHGLCDVNNGKAVCSCEERYTLAPNGWTCEADLTIIGPTADCPDSNGCSLSVKSSLIVVVGLVVGVIFLRLYHDH